MEQDTLNQKSAWKAAETLLGGSIVVYFGSLTKLLTVVLTHRIYIKFSNNRISGAKGSAPDNFITARG